MIKHPHPTPDVVLNHLNQTRHIIGENTTPSMFDTPKTNHPEYWLLSDLQKLYGPIFHLQNNRRLDDIIIPLIITPKHSTTYSNHIVTTPGRPSDVRLSRYACLRITEGYIMDPTGQAYFLCPDADPAKIQYIANNITRLNLRKQIARTEQIIGGILHRRNTKYTTFYNIANNAFFGDLDIQHIKNCYGIENRSKDPISNYMGTLALKARLDGLNQTIQIANHRDNSICHAANVAMRIARTEMYANHHIRPEQDITTTPIKEIQSEYNKLERAFIKAHINQSIL